MGADSLNTPVVNNVMMNITDAEFKEIRDIVYKNFGINLTEQKRNLVVGRLQKRLRKRNISTFEEYIRYLKNNPKELNDLVDMISTNHTFFFRENEHFKFFSQVAIPEIIERHNRVGDNDIRIWCAAAATGEEPYTILMTMLETFGNNYKSWDAGLLATDVSEEALATAQKGVYPRERLDKTEPALISKYFTKTADGNFAVKDILKREVIYRRFNLMNTKMPFRKKFDLIFCRNVMIYFDQETRDALVERFYDVTEPGGYLFIGHSESLGRDRTRWQYVSPATYRKEE